MQRKYGVSSPGTQFKFHVLFHWRVYAPGSSTVTSYRIVPMSVQRHGISAAGFWIFDDRMVHLGIPSAEIKVTRPQEVQLYRRLFAALQ